MATIFYRKNKSGKFLRPYITFSFAGHRYRRSLGLIAYRTAVIVLSKIRVMLVLLATGMASVPKGRTICDFILSCHLNAIPAPVHCESKFNFLVKAYLDVHRPPVKAESTWKMEKIHLGHFLNVLGDTPLVSLDTTLIEQYRKKRCSQVRATTVNKEMATLRLVLSWAQKKGLIEENPMDNIQPLKIKSGDRRFLTCSQINERLDKNDLSDKQKQEILRSRLLDWQDIEELICLARERDPDFAPLLVTAVYTGMRRGELIGLQWPDVDLKRGILIARSAKQSRRYSEIMREIPIHPNLRKVLLDQKKKFVYRIGVFGKGNDPFTKNTLTYYFKKLIKNTQYQGLGLHAFRHAFASHLTDAGVDQRVINELMGHTTEQMSQRYRHLFPKRKSEAIESLK